MLPIESESVQRAIFWICRDHCRDPGRAASAGKMLVPANGTGFLIALLGMKIILMLDCPM